MAAEPTTPDTRRRATPGSGQLDHSQAPGGAERRHRPSRGPSRRPNGRPRPLEPAAATVRRFADAYPGVEVEVDAPNPLQLESRGRARSELGGSPGTGCCVVLFASVVVLAVSFFVDDSTFGTDYAPTSAR